MLIGKEILAKINGESVKDQERFTTYSKSDRDLFVDAMNYTSNKVYGNLDAFTTKFPSAESVKLVYQPVDNATNEFYSDWTSSFWTGMLWIVYELTGNQRVKEAAEIQVESFKKRYHDKNMIDHHDIGFLYSLSCTAAYKVTGSESAKEIALAAADHLAARYLEKAKVIQHNGKITDLSSERSGVFIIDCCMNLPLLYWAAGISGNGSYYKKACSHITQAAKYLVREDGSTFQAYKIDAATGNPVRGWTNQGYSDEACWSRGQAWAIYGMALSYRYTGDKGFLEISKHLINYFLNRLPTDKVCAWDLVFTNDDVQRDSSAAAIAVCGILETASHLPLSDEDRGLYERAAVSILRSLAENYTTKDHPESNGILMHGVYSFRRHGRDECCIWGDYFYTEALMRVLKNLRLYW